MIRSGSTQQRHVLFARACARIKSVALLRRIFQLIAVLFVSSFPLQIVHAASPKFLNPKTATAVQNMTSASFSVCLPAIESLGRANDPAVVAPLANALAAESRPLVRRYLVDALGTTRQTSAIPALKTGLQDSDTQVRQSAVAALGLFSNADAQGALSDHAAVETNPAVRKSLVHQMHFSKWSKSHQALVTLSLDSDPGVRQLAVDALPQNSSEKNKAQ